RVGRNETAGDPQQGRFPGSVLPDERVDLARPAVDADVPQRLDGAERLGDALHRENRRRHVPGSSSSPRPTWRARQTTVAGGATGLWGGGARGGTARLP